jgi:hypothetical protein
MSQLQDDLTATPITDVSLSFFWYDNGTDVIDASLNERIFLVTPDGAVTLTHDSGSFFKATAHLNLLDSLYNDNENIDSDRFYTSYKNNYQAHTLTDATNDLSMNIDICTNNNLLTIGDSFENNDLIFDLSLFALGDISDVVTETYDVRLSTSLEYLTVADTSESSLLNVVFTRAGISTPVVPTIYVGEQDINLPLTVKALTTDALISFTTDFSQNEVYKTTFPRPSVYFANMMDDTSGFNFGTHDVSVNMVVPETSGLKSGSWNSIMTFSDMVSTDASGNPYPASFVQNQAVRVIVMPQFSHPVIDISDNVGSIDVLTEISSDNHATAHTNTISLSYAAADICDNDILVWGKYLEVTADIVDVSGDEVTVTTDTSGFLTLDTSVNNFNVIDASGETITFTVTYNGHAYNIIDDSDYSVRIRWRPQGGNSWSSQIINNTITRSYTEQLQISNNYNATYTIDTYTIYGTDKIVVFDISDNTAQDLDIDTFTFTGSDSHDYYAYVTDISDNEYIDTRSDILFVYQYDESLNMINKFDGTYSINNIPNLSNGDLIKIQNSTDDTLLEYDSSNNEFTPPSLDISYSTIIYTIDDISYSNTTSNVIVKYYDEQLDISNNYDGTYSVANLPTLYNNDVIKINNLTDVSLYDLSDNNIFTPDVDSSYNVSIYSSGNDEYTNITSSVIIERYSEQLDISNNYDGTYSVANVPTLYNDDVIKLRNLTDLSVTDICNNEFEISDIDASYNVSIYRGDNEYTNITSVEIKKHYDTSLNITNNYDGTYSVANVPDLFNGDVIKIQDLSNSTLTLLNLETKKFTPIVDISYNVSIYNSEDGPFTNITSNIITEYYSEQLDISNNLDGTYSVANVPTLYNDDVIKYHNLETGIRTEISNNEFTASDIDASYNVSIYRGDNEYTNITSDNIVEHYDTSLNITNNYDGTFTVTNIPSLYNGDTIKYQDLSNNTLFDLSMNTYTFTPTVDISYNVSVFRNDDIPYGHTTSNIITKYYEDIKITIANNYGGTYTVTNPHTAYGTHKIKYYDGETIYDLCMNTLIFDPTIDLSYNVSVYDGNEAYTNTTSEYIMKHYDTSLNNVNNYDGTYTITNIPTTLYDGDTVQVYDISANTLSPLNTNTDTFTLNGTDEYYVSIYNANLDISYSNLTTAVVANYDTSLEITNKYDGTYTVSNIPTTLYDNDTVKIHDLSNNTLEDLSGDTFTPIKNIQYNVSVYGDDLNDISTKEYVNLRTDTITEYYDERIEWQNNYDGTFTLLPYDVNDNDILIVTVVSVDDISRTTLITSTSLRTISVFVGETMFAHIIKNDNTDIYTHTRSVNIVNNNILYIVNDLSSNGVSISAGLTNNGFDYSGDVDIVASDDDLVTLSKNDSTTFNVISTIDKPTWFDDISNNIDVSITVTENIMVDDNTNVSSVSIATNDIDVSNNGSVNTFEYSSQASSIGDEFTTTVVVNTVRNYGSTITTFIKYIIDDEIVGANYSTHYIRPTNAQYDGGKFNNLIIHNDLSLNMLSGGGNALNLSNSMGIGYSMNDISDNTYINLATTQGGVFNINFGKTTFIGTDISHDVVASSMTAATIKDNGQSYNLNNGVISLGYFTGTIDIVYNDIYAEVRSESTNTMRLIVVPRAELTYEIIDISLNHLTQARPGYITQGVQNVQKNGVTEITFTPTDIICRTASGSNSGTTLSDIWTDVTKVTWKSRDVSGNNELFSVYGDSNDLPDSSLNVINYGTAKYGIIEFAGLDISSTDVSAHSIDYVGTIEYTRTSNINTTTTKTISATTSFTLEFVDDADLDYVSEINTSNLNIAESSTLNNVMVTKYITSTEDMDLTTNVPSYVYVIIENNKLGNIVITYNGVTTISLPFATRATFLRQNSNSWTLLYSETVTA